MRAMMMCRVTVRLTSSEKEAWASQAKADGGSLTEFIKRSVRAACFAPTPDEMSELKALADELPAAAGRMAKTLDAVIAQLDHSLDPARDIEMQQRVTIELLNNPPMIDWSKFGHRFSET